ncbi:MAG: hypothetical protein HQ522_17140 [Bacteroidetes bacterium]|nr:hypothetical protein [Bacteroidota bacterium]
MKIKKLRVEKLRNEEHFQFQTEFNELVTRFTAQTLGVETPYAAYQTHYGNEAEALDVIQKSAITSEMVDADHDRDNLFSGLNDTVEGACNHYDPIKKEAGLRLKIVFDHFGNISKKSYDEETAATNALINDLGTKYTDDVATLGLEDWITALDASNQKFVALSAERYSDDADKTPLKMKEVRIEVDAAYRSITNLIDALILVNGLETYSPFVEELNRRVEKYNNNLAQRQGRNAKNDTPE